MRPKSAQVKRAQTTGQKAAEIRPESAQPGSNRSDRALAEQALGQHGILTLAQLAALGLSPRATRHRVASGRLTRVHTGVYAIGRPGPNGLWMAAVLACGAGAMLSHRSAAALWGFAKDGVGVDVTVPGRAGRSRAGIQVHRGESLLPQDVTVHDGIPCTTAARTFLDLAAIIDRRTLERAIDRAETLRQFDLDTLQELLQRNPQRHGTRAIATILADYAAPIVTRSVAEDRMLELIAVDGLPRPQVNAWIPLEGNSGYEADFLWPDARLIVEVDGRSHHTHRSAFVQDRRRDRRLALAGFETRRYAAAELTSDPQRVVAELRAFLARHRR